MLTYSYTARDTKTGDKVSAELEAENPSAAAKLLTERGLSPLEITAKKNRTGPLGAIANRIPAKHKVIFSRQLATLINAGLPLVQSLSSVQEQTTNKAFKTVIGKVINDLESGASFAAALSQHPKSQARIEHMLKTRKRLAN